MAEAVRSLHDAFFRDRSPPRSSARRRRADRSEPPTIRRCLAATLLASGRAARNAAVRLRPRDDRRARRGASPSSAARSRPPALRVQGERAPRDPDASRARRDVGIEAASPGEGSARPCVRARPGARRSCSATNARATDLADLAVARVPARAGIAVGRAAGRRARAGTPVLLRINPGVGDGHHRHVVTGGAQSKFGIPLGAARTTRSPHAATRGLAVLGLHAHMGSGILDPAPLLASARALLLAARP